MNFSARTLRQIVVLDLVESVLDNVPASYADAGESVPDEMGTALARVKRARAACSKRITGGRLEVTEKEWRRYARTLEGIKAQIHAAWPGERIPVRQYLNAVLLLVEDERSQTPTWPLARKVEWNDLAGHMADLYAHYDPELDHVEDQEHGARAGERMKEVVAA